MAGLLDQILSGNNPTVANIDTNIAFDTASIIRIALGLLCVGLILIMLGYLANKKPLVVLGFTVLTIIVTIIYFNQK